MLERDDLVQSEYFIFDFAYVVFRVFEAVILCIEVGEELCVNLLQMAQEDD